MLARRYLQANAIPGRWPLAALALILLYQVFTFPGANSVSIVYLIALFLLGLLLRAPRWMLYLALLIALALQVRFFTDLASRQAVFEHSSRDDAAEATARAFLRGQNPWNHIPELGEIAATTGPAGVLLAVPFVLGFGEINWLAFIFWMSFASVLLAADIRRRNGTFPFLALILLLGLFGIAPTLQYSLDELYFPMLWLVSGYVALSRDQWLLGGAALATAVLSRSNYLFLVAGVLLWYAGRYRQVAWRPWIRLAAGGLAAAVVIVAPFVVIGGREFLAYNSFQSAFRLSGEPFPAGAHPFFGALGALAAVLGPGALRLLKLGLVAGGLLVLAWRASQRWSHPFWHVTAAAFLAHTVGWFPANLAMDYALIFVLPAMLAVALDEPPRLPATA